MIQGGFGTGPEPYHLPIRNAYNLVVGEIPGAVMKGDGTLLNLDTTNWAPWDIEVGEDDHAPEVIRTGSALRRGVGVDFLVYGRMLAPAAVENIKTMSWENSDHYTPVTLQHNIPAIFHSAWSAPDGRFGIVLANWTTEEQEVTVSDPRLGYQVTGHFSSKSLESKTLEVEGSSLSISVPPLGCVLVEAKRK